MGVGRRVKERGGLFHRIQKIRKRCRKRMDSASFRRRFVVGGNLEIKGPGILFPAGGFRRIGDGIDHHGHQHGTEHIQDRVLLLSIRWQYRWTPSGSRRPIPEACSLKESGCGRWKYGPRWSCMHGCWGNTLIHGSMLHSFATRKQKIFLSGSMAGRKSVPLGYRVHTRRLMVMPVKKRYTAGNNRPCW